MKTLSHTKILTMSSIKDSVCQRMRNWCVTTLAGKSKIQSVFCEFAVTEVLIIKVLL